MQKIINMLEEIDFKLDKCHALEFFAREGDWQTIHYSGKVASLEAWEIDPKFEPALRANLPTARIFICDSYKQAHLSRYQNFFDLIVLDNPQNCFGSNLEHCEHFDALPLASKMLKDGDSIIIFNINHKPFNFSDHPRWQRARSEFYSLDDTSEIAVDFLKDFYANFFRKNGFGVRDIFEVKRNQTYLSYFVVLLKRSTT